MKSKRPQVRMFIVFDTPTAARQLGITARALEALVKKDPDLRPVTIAGHPMWRPSDIARIRVALAKAARSPGSKIKKANT